MRDITSLLVTQYRLFRPDVLPYQLLITPAGTQIFQGALQFRQVTWAQNGDYMFQDGAFTYADKPCVIQAFAINARRIWLQVLGDSAAANHAYGLVLEALAHLAPGVQGAEPMFVSEETSCAVTLELDWPMLLNPAVVESAESAIGMLSGLDALFSIKHVNLQFTLSGAVENEEHKGYGITIGEKILAVEPQLDVPLAERRYFTASPLGSDAHLRFVEELERKLLRNATSRRK